MANEEQQTKFEERNSDVLVRVDGVSKKFCKSLKQSLWYGAMDTLSEFTGRARRQSLRENEFWAVSDVSFELRRGECLGLIGRNGAGKSTLLKMLNGLIKPDAGRIEMHGRICALIELSAGFNPILTGRENIYNRGAILGFSKKEIDEKFDAIVEFAEVGPFLDMPLQNYSSGMKVRLGFAVSAQMEPDVLIIDEVLAVGDLGFVVKCLNRMAEIIPNSALIFVTHSMPWVARICTHALLMDHAKVRYSGNDVPLAIEQYTHMFETGGKADHGSGEIVITRVGLRANSGDAFVFDHSFTHENGHSLQIRLEYDVKALPIHDANLFVIILDQQLREIVECTSEETTMPFRFTRTGPFTVDVALSHLYLNRGKHTITVGATDGKTNQYYCRTTNTIAFMVKTKIQRVATCMFPGKWECRESPGQGMTTP